LIKRRNIGTVNKREGADLDRGLMRRKDNGVTNKNNRKIDIEGIEEAQVKKSNKNSVKISKK
jgi:hypothetical protein